jgi:serine/threonine protein kinase
MVLFIGFNIFLISQRDLKPENILYESSKKGSGLKVVDFGTSRLFEQN